MEEKARNQIIDRKLCFEKALGRLDIFFIGNNKEGLYKFVLDAVQKPLIEKVLERTSGNQLKAAKILGMNRNTLHSKIKKLGIEIKKWKK